MPAIALRQQQPCLPNQHTDNDAEFAPLDTYPIHIHSRTHCQRLPADPGASHMHTFEAKNLAKENTPVAVPGAHRPLAAVQQRCCCCNVAYSQPPGRRHLI